MGVYLLSETEYPITNNSEGETLSVDVTIVFLLLIIEDDAIKLIKKDKVIHNTKDAFNDFAKKSFAFLKKFIVPPM